MGKDSPYAQKIRFLLAVGSWFGLVASLNAQNIANTVHNLSVSGSGAVKASDEPQICIFCHTPHTSNPQAPLWNRDDPGLSYTLYSSTTFQGQNSQPDGSSILCLSCHDGTIALGNISSRATDITMAGGVTTMPAGNTNLSQDLSDDHPVSFLYSSSLAGTDGQLADPGTLPSSIHLESGKLQCRSCHDPHKDIYHDFLTVDNKSSELCLLCHQNSGWNTASHKTSAATWNGSGNNPWPHTDFSTVSENGCENCHNPHNANGGPRLTNYYREEDNCLNCHNGSVAATDIQSDFNKQWKHNGSPTTNIHQPNESIPVQTQHVECVDCHNPHAANYSAAVAPDAKGVIGQVAGVNSDGNAVNPVQFEYELCYKCHADSPDKPGTNIPRDIVQTNTRLEFDANSISFHPVESAGPNNNVPSLVTPYTESSIIYCSDCHASNNSSAGGPHGSDYPHLLKYNYETADNTPESYQAYELCYQCHDYNSIVNNNSNEFYNKVHNKHIQDEDTPCVACHDAHGISSSQGNATNNTHLINFNVAIVSQSTGASGRLEFVDEGNFRGSCYLNCHGKNHNPKSYQ